MLFKLQVIACNFYQYPAICVPFSAAFYFVWFCFFVSASLHFQKLLKVGKRNKGLYLTLDPSLLTYKQAPWVPPVETTIGV